MIRLLNALVGKCFPRVLPPAEEIRIRLRALKDKYK